MKDTIEFFGELDTLAREKPSEQRTRLIQVVLDNDFVEMILAMWTNDWKVEMLESSDELPTYLQTSLQVIYFLYCVYSSSSSSSSENAGTNLQRWKT